MRWVRTRVLPEPAPATISRGPASCTTASRWTGLRPSSMGASGYLPVLMEESPTDVGDSSIRRRKRAPFGARSARPPEGEAGGPHVPAGSTTGGGEAYFTITAVTI